VSTAAFVNAAAIFTFATEAYQHIARRRPGDRDPNQTEAITAIVFAAASLEAFINELGAFARYPPALPTSPDPESVRIFGAAMTEMENDRASIYLKFQLARWIFAGQGYPRGEEPYQSFRLLMKLRDEILHFEMDEYRPGEMMKREDYPSFVEGLRSKNILVDTGEMIMSWLSMAMTLATARWACNSATRMVRSVLEILPSSGLRERAEFFFGPLRFDQI
jgi:hypothetical protein